MAKERASLRLCRPSLNMASDVTLREMPTWPGRRGWGDVRLRERLLLFQQWWRY